MMTPDTTETSQEILDAIAACSADRTEQERIWNDPTEEELIAIWEFVTKNGLIASTAFFWGVEGHRWAHDIEQ